VSTYSLLTRLDAAQPTLRRRDTYFKGEQPLRFMADKVSPETMEFRSNLARKAISAVVKRVKLEDVEASVTTRAGTTDVTEEARELLEDSDLTMTLGSVVTDMLALGSAYLIVWADDDGNPVVSGESAEEVAVERDPLTRGVKEAVKRWEVRDANGVLIEQHVMKYGKDKIVHLRRNDTGGKLQYVDSTNNPLGVVPVVPLVNVERIHDDVGVSVIDDLAPLLDALNKVIVDMLTTSDAVARPKRYATGVVLEDDDEGGFIADDGFTADGGGDQEPAADDDNGGVASPFKDSDDLWISEQSEAKFGQLAGADLSGYKTAVDLILQQIMAISSLPGHMVGITTANPSTAEALRAAEVDLSDEAEGRVRVINRPMEWATRILVAIHKGVKPEEVTVRLRWADTATRSIAQEADAAVKLHNEGVTSTEEARESTGTDRGIS